MLNPDGVAAGHWRNNLGGKDLNRDWGPFTQPETQLVQSLIDDFVAAGRRIRLFLDFHSTRSNLFYTQADEEQTDPHNFANRWLEAARARLTDYPFSQERRHNEGRPTAKSYMYDRFGIPSITYEVGDEIDRLVAADAAVVFAEEMMRALMENID
jgi:predicted deacylase